MKQKALIIENVGDLEERMAAFLKKNPIEDTRREFHISDRTQEQLIEIFTDPTLTELTFESSLNDRKQFLKIICMLNKLRDKIAFRKIRILFLFGQFELFLSKLIVEEPEFKEPLIELFKHFEIFGIEHQMFEDKNPKGFFKKIEFFFDEIKLEPFTWMDGDTSFFFERSPIIDTRAELRSKTTIGIDKKIAKSEDFKEFIDPKSTEGFIPFSKDFINSEILEDFFIETDAMFNHQLEIIEERKDEDYESLKASNLNSQAALGLLRIKFKLFQETAKHEHAK